MLMAIAKSVTITKTAELIIVGGHHSDSLLKLQLRLVFADVVCGGGRRLSFQEEQ